MRLISWTHPRSSETVCDTEIDIRTGPTSTFVCDTYRYVRTEKYFCMRHSKIYTEQTSTFVCDLKFTELFEFENHNYALLRLPPITKDMPHNPGIVCVFHS
jgi:hypothetical protein